MRPRQSNPSRTDATAEALASIRSKNEFLWARSGSTLSDSSSEAKLRGVHPTPAAATALRISSSKSWSCRARMNRFETPFANV